MSTTLQLLLLQDTTYICETRRNYVMWDFLALLLNGTSWRLIALLLLFFQLRPAMPGPYDAIKGFFSWCIPRVGRGTRRGAKRAMAPFARKKAGVQGTQLEETPSKVG